MPPNAIIILCRSPSNVGLLAPWAKELVENLSPGSLLPGLLHQCIVATALSKRTAQSQRSVDNVLVFGDSCFIVVYCYKMQPVYHDTSVPRCFGLLYVTLTVNPRIK